MFQAMISPIIRSTRLCVTACGIIHPRCCRPVAGNIVGALYHKLKTQSNAREDGRNRRLKHVELIGIINKLLLLPLVGCQYYLNRAQFACFYSSVTVCHLTIQWMLPGITAV